MAEIKPLPVQVAKNMIIGRQRCGSCGDVSWVLWVDLVQEPFDFECTECGQHDCQLLDSGFVIDVADSDRAMFICKDAVDAVQIEAVKAIRSRES